VESSPAASATNVAVNAVVRLRFSEQLDPVSVNASTVLVQDSQGAVGIVPTLESDGRTLTIVPNQPYGSGRSHTVFVWGVKDLSGNTINTNRSSSTAFAADESSPLVTKTSIADGQSAVPLNAVIEAAFDEPISPFALSGVGLTVSGQPVAATKQLSGDRRAITFKLVQPLTTATTYVLAIAGVTDLSGNALAVPRSVTFTTGATADLVPPAPVSWTPVPNTTDVARNTPVQVQLNERVNPLTVTPDSIRLFDHDTGQFVVGSVSVSADGRTITFLPAALLGANRGYSMYVTYSTYVEDQAGNRFITRWSFTTGAQ
jgi:hypothetical protein